MSSPPENGIYQVTCKKCQGKSTVGIDSKYAVSDKYLGLMPGLMWMNVGTIISGRFRMDGGLGWQCMCGNNTILTSQEKRHIANPAEPQPQEIAEIVKNIEKDNHNTFKLELQ